MTLTKIWTIIHAPPSIQISPDVPALMLAGSLACSSLAYTYVSPELAPATALGEQMKLSNAFIQLSLTGVSLEELAFMLCSIRLQLSYLGFQLVTFLEMPPLVLLIAPYHMQ